LEWTHELQHQEKGHIERNIPGQGGIVSNRHRKAPSWASGLAWKVIEQKNKEKKKKKKKKKIKKS
jgi:hypothetical protein